MGRLIGEIDGFEGQATTRIGLKLLAILAHSPGEIRNAVWSIPAAKMKMRRDHNVPLPDEAIPVLEELKLMNKRGDYLFPPLRL